MKTPTKKIKKSRVVNVESSASRIMRTILDGYHNRDDYPPFALTSWEDRNRFSAYIRKVLEEIETRGELIYKSPSNK